MNEEQLYRLAFDELVELHSNSESNLALVKAQAEYYFRKNKELLEEITILKSENEELKNKINTPDISDVINKTTEENK